jgi:hypothetical protein
LLWCHIVLVGLNIKVALSVLGSGILCVLSRVTHQLYFRAVGTVGGKGQIAPLYILARIETKTSPSKDLGLLRTCPPPRFLDLPTALWYKSAVHTATAICNKRQAIPIKKKTGPHWPIQLWFVSYYYTHSLYHFINSAILALKSDIVTFYSC